MRSLRSASEFATCSRWLAGNVASNAVSLDWSDWLLIASILVIVGVVLEGHELLLEVKEKGWYPIWTKVGFSLLVIGLALEVVFQSEVQSADAKLKRESDARIAALTVEATAAEGKIADAQRDAAIASDRAGQANKAAGEANERAAKIEAAAAWRVLTQDQISRFVTSLSASRHTVQIAFMKGDPESQFLELQFADAVNRAGWEYGSWEVHLERIVFFGLAVLDDKPNKEAGQALLQALSDAGVGANRIVQLPGQGYEGDGGYHQADVTLLIGSKFPPGSILAGNKPTTP